jgi:hypothetical protein
MKTNALIPSLFVAGSLAFAVIGITLLDAVSLGNCEATYSADVCAYTLR